MNDEPSLVARALARARREVARASLRARLETLGRLRDRNLDPPIFVVGCGHSGNSVVLAILDTHPRIRGVPRETRMFFRDPRERQRKIDDLRRQTILAGKERWADKTPRHIRKLDLLFEEIPDARVVLMLRDGRDVICSLRARYDDLVRACRRWVKDNQLGLPFHDHPNVKIVRYEDLVTDSEATISGVIDFVGESFDAALLRHHEQERRWTSGRIARPEAAPRGQAHGDLRAWQINQPIYDGRGRWKTQLSDADRVIVKREAGEMLARLGYVHDDEAW